MLIWLLCLLIEFVTRWTICDEQIPYSCSFPNIYTQIRYIIQLNNNYSTSGDDYLTIHCLLVHFHRDMYYDEQIGFAFWTFSSKIRLKICWRCYLNRKLVSDWLKIQIFLLENAKWAKKFARYFARRFEYISEIMATTRGIGTKNTRLSASKPQWSPCSLACSVTDDEQARPCSPGICTK